MHTRTYDEFHHCLMQPLPTLTRLIRSMTDFDSPCPRRVMACARSATPAALLKSARTPAPLSDALRAPSRERMPACTCRSFCAAADAAAAVPVPPPRLPPLTGRAIRSASASPPVAPAGAGSAVSSGAADAPLMLARGDTLVPSSAKLARMRALAVLRRSTSVASPALAQKQALVPSSEKSVRTRVHVVLGRSTLLPRAAAPAREAADRPDSPPLMLDTCWRRGLPLGESVLPPISAAPLSSPLTLPLRTLRAAAFMMLPFMLRWSGIQGRA